MPNVRPGRSAPKNARGDPTSAPPARPGAPVTALPAGEVAGGPHGTSETAELQGEPGGTELLAPPVVRSNQRVAIGIVSLSVRLRPKATTCHPFALRTPKRRLTSVVAPVSARLCTWMYLLPS